MLVTMPSWLLTAATPCPADAPFVDAEGKRHWINGNQWGTEDVHVSCSRFRCPPPPPPRGRDLVAAWHSNQTLPAPAQRFQYVWVEHWSADRNLPYYHNQKTQASTWELPIDLAWRR
jgi:hypothetical protein